MSESSPTLIAFAGQRRIAAGSPLETALQAQAHLRADPEAQVLVFDVETGHQVELDLRGGPEDIAARLERRDGSVSAPPATPAGRGRPRLGVTAREVTLLPRHWDWLATQQGGTSVALRKLVEQAMRQPGEGERSKRRSEAVYRFMVAIAGNEPGFDEVARALFAGNAAQLRELTNAWPADVRAHLFAMLEPGSPEEAR